MMVCSLEREEQHLRGPGVGHMSRDTHYVIDSGHHIRPCQANLTPSHASYNYLVCHEEEEAEKSVRAEDIALPD